MSLWIGIAVGWSLAGIFMTMWLFTLRTRAYSVDEAAAKTRDEARHAVEFLQDFAVPASGCSMANAVDSFLVPWAMNDTATLRTVWPEWFAHRDRNLLTIPQEKSA